MAITNGYLTLAQLQQAVGDTTFEFDEVWERAIEAASRQIDEWCGRYFYQDATATARLFRADDNTYVCTGDFDSTADVVVATDEDGDGVFETPWMANEWQAEPLVRYNQRPFERITTTTRTREFPVDGRRPKVQVTATWGWGKVPETVEQACSVLASLYFRSKDWSGQSFGLDLQGSQGGEEKFTADPLHIAKKLVMPYVVEGGLLYQPPDCC